VNDPDVPTVRATLFELVIVGAAVKLAMSVKLWVAFTPIPFSAVITIGYAPWVPVAGVPLSTPVVEFRVTPVGSAPVSLNVGAGKPVAVTVKVPSDPTANVVLFWLAIEGDWSTVSVKLCVAFVPVPFCAVMAIGKTPPAPAPGVPPSTPVVEFKVTPAGNAPVSLNVGAGNPVAATVKVPNVPTVNVVLFPLVITGAKFTVRVKFCVAFVPMPFCAVIVSG
jgi:hypothetical protein